MEKEEYLKINEKIANLYMVMATMLMAFSGMESL